MMKKRQTVQISKVGKVKTWEWQGKEERDLIGRRTGPEIWRLSIGHKLWLEGGLEEEVGGEDAMH